MLDDQDQDRGTNEPDPDGDAQDGGGDEPEPISFSEAVGIAASGAALARNADEAKYWNEIDDPVDLLEPEAQDRLAFLEQLGPHGETVKGYLEGFAQAERDAAEQHRIEQAKSDEKERLDELRAQRNEDRRKAEEDIQKKERDAKLLAQLDEEERSAGPTTSPQDVMRAVVADVTARIEELRSRPVMPGSAEERELGELADKGIETLSSLESSNTATKFDRDALARSADEKLQQLREE